MKERVESRPLADPFAGPAGKRYSSVGSGSFLLADGDGSRRGRFEQAFKEAGIDGRLHVVPDGEAAIAYLHGGGVYSDRREYPMPSVVMLELGLPRKSGFEVVHWIRARAALKTLVVILLTACNRSDDADRAYNLGADYYLTKPQSFGDLVAWSRCLDAWLGCNICS